MSRYLYAHVRVDAVDATIAVVGPGGTVAGETGRQEVGRVAVFRIVSERSILFKVLWRTNPHH
jgi:hypothetical protein